MIRITEEDKWLPFNGMQPFKLFTHILTLVTCPPRLSLYLTKIILPFLISSRWLIEKCSPKHRNAKVFVKNAIRLAKSVSHSCIP